MKLFKDLKQGEAVHVLDRKSAEYFVGTVEDTPSLPHYDSRLLVTTVDVRLNIKGDSRVYSIPENLSVTYSNDLCIATDQHDLIAIVDEIAAKADEAIANYPHQLEVRDKCKALALELNPERKAKQENEERMTRMEERQDKMFAMLEDFMRKNSTVV